MANERDPRACRFDASCLATKQLRTRAPTLFNRNRPDPRSFPRTPPQIKFAAMSHLPPGIAALPNDSKSGKGPSKSPVYRRSSSAQAFPALLAHDGVPASSLYELFTKSAAKHADLPCLGRRTMLVSCKSEGDETVSVWPRASRRPRPPIMIHMHAHTRNM